MVRSLVYAENKTSSFDLRELPTIWRVGQSARIPPIHMIFTNIGPTLQIGIVDIVGGLQAADDQTPLAQHYP